MPAPTGTCDPKQGVGLAGDATDDVGWATGVVVAGKLDVALLRGQVLLLLKCELNLGGLRRRCACMAMQCAGETDRSEKSHTFDVRNV